MYCVKKIQNFTNAFWSESVSHAENILSRSNYIKDSWLNWVKILNLLVCLLISTFILYIFPICLGFLAFLRFFAYLCFFVFPFCYSTSCSCIPFVSNQYYCLYLPSICPFYSVLYALTFAIVICPLSLWSIIHTNSCGRWREIFPTITSASDALESVEGKRSFPSTNLSYEYSYFAARLDSLWGVSVYKTHTAAFHSYNSWGEGVILVYGTWRVNTILILSYEKGILA